MPKVGRQFAQDGYTLLLTEAQRQGDDQVREIMRQLARNDLFFLLVNVLNRKDADREWLFERCREVQENPNGYIDLWGRDHYKSSIITFALTIQDILNNPEITVGIFSHTRPIAKAFLRQIKREFEENFTLKFLFPEILWQNPKTEAPKWSEDDGLVVRRQSNPKESTLEAWGLVDGQPTGRHYLLMVYDDVVTRESVNTPEMIAKTTMAWELSQNLLNTEMGKVRYIGTRYHYHDTYRTIIDRGTAIPRIYPATVDGTAEGEPVLLTREQLAQKRRDQGPWTFSCQLLLNPHADAMQGFSEEWLRYWDADSTQGMNLYILVDPASEKKKNSDFTTMTVVGLGIDEKVYVVEWVRDRLNLTERANKLFELHRRHRPLEVGYEQYGLQADIEHYEDRMRRENYRFEITKLGGQIKKEDRIKRLVPDFEQHRIYIPQACQRNNYEGIWQNLTEIFVQEEFLFFPVGSHDDMLDSLSRIYDVDLLWPEMHRQPKVLTQAEIDWRITTGQPINEDGAQVFNDEGL